LFSYNPIIFLQKIAPNFGGDFYRDIQTKKPRIDAVFASEALAR
jgi:hypothetical protein